MSLKAAALRHEKGLLISLTSLASFIITALMLRHGVGATSDSWAYWEGSVNLIERGRYEDMLGEPITGWPPFFSIFLALFQIPLSQTGWTLALAMSVISALISGVWSAYVFQVFAGGGSAAKPAAFAGSLVFVALFASLCCTALLAHSLLLVFLGMLFHDAAAIADRPGEWVSFKRPFVAGLILAGGMLTHNSTVIFVVSIALVVLAAAGGSLLQRLAAVAGIVIISLAPWFVVRRWLGQEGSHSIGKPAYSFIDYAGQVPRNVGIFFIPSGSLVVQTTVGIVILAAALVLWAGRSKFDLAKRHRVLLGLALAALAGHFLLFNLVWIDAPIGGRFIWFFALAVTPVLFYAASKRVALVAVLLFLTVGVSGWRDVKYVWHGAVPRLAINAGPESSMCIYSPYFLTSRADADIPAGGIQISPPIFPWQIVPPGMKDQVEEVPTVQLIKAGPEKDR